MIVSIIVAMDRNCGIGKENRLPWRLPKDMKIFRDMTMGHHVIVGRKTFESFRKPLVGRHTIVVTRNAGYQANGCLLAHSLKDALSLAEAHGENEVFVIGGAEIYAQTLSLADRIYLTHVDAEVEADAFFPLIQENAWKRVSREYYPPDSENPYGFTFEELISLKHANHLGSRKELLQNYPLIQDENLVFA